MYDTLNSHPVLRRPTHDARSPSTSSSCTSSPSGSVAMPSRNLNMHWLHAAEATKQQAGIDPSVLRGKTLMHVCRSKKHPALSLYFTDKTSYQVLVYGYDPLHPGLPKELEMDSGIEAVFDPPEGWVNVNLTVVDARMVTLADKAFQAGSKGAQWTQDHKAFAIKFKEDGRWHCVWASLSDWQKDAFGQPRCVFRNFHDVYMEQCNRPVPERSSNPTPKKPRTSYKSKGDKPKADKPRMERLKVDKMKVDKMEHDWRAC